MTDTTIPPLTEADVKALGFTPFGFERDDRMGGVLAHRDGEAYYMQRAAAFWSIDPEYGNMRNVLCEEPPYWREWRTWCNPRLIVATDVLLWRVSDLPADRVERLFNYDTIAPVLAGLKAQAESTVKNIVETKVTPGDWAGNAPTEPPSPTKRRPLVVGDQVVPMYGYGERATPEVLIVCGVQRGVLFNGIETQVIETLEGLFTDSAVILLPREGE